MERRGLFNLLYGVIINCTTKAGKFAHYEKLLNVFLVFIGRHILLVQEIKFGTYLLLLQTVT